MFRCEMLPLQRASISPTKRSLHSEYIRYFDLFPHGNPGRRLLRLMHREPALLKTEEIAYLTQHIWEYTRLVWFLWVVVAVHENVLAPGMAMEITIEGEVALFGETLDEALDGVHYWVQHFGWCFPAAVQVGAT